MKYFSPFLLGLSLFLLLSPEVFAQKLLQYDSLYHPLSDLVGHAKFTYITGDEGNIIKEGDFRFVSRNKDTAQCENMFSNHIWEGTYEDDQKTGDWTYRMESSLVDIKHIQDQQLYYDIISNSTLLEGPYVAGLPQGNWQYHAYQQINDNKKDPSERIDTRYVAGRVDGVLQYTYHDGQDSAASVQGKVADGLMVGTWEFSYSEDGRQITEKRTYEQGVLLTLVKSSEGRILQEIEFPVSEALQAALVNDEHELLANRPLSLSFSDGYPRNSAYLKEQQSGNRILQSIVAKLTRYDPTLIETNGLPFGTNRAFYPLTAEEKNAKDKWLSEWANYQANIDKLEIDVVESFRQSKDSVISAISQWTKEQKKLSEYIASWDKIIYTDEVEFHNREGMLIDYAKELLSADTLQINEKRQIYHYAVDEKYSNNFIAYVAQNLSKRNQVADSLLDVYSTRMNFLTTVYEMKQLNDTIQNKLEEISAIHQTIQPYEGISKLTRYYQNFLIDSLFQTDYEKFLSNEQDIEEKQSIADELFNTLGIIKEVYLLTDTVAQNRQKLDSLYTNYTFDPFTFSDSIPVRIKNRLYDQVAVELYREVLNKVTKAESPIEALELLTDLNAVQERMEFLVYRETGKLERQLSRADDLEEKFALLKEF